MKIQDLPKSIFYKGKEYGLSIEYGRYSKEWYLCYKFYHEYDEPTAIHKCYDPELINCMHKLKDLISVPGVNQKDSANKAQPLYYYLQNGEIIQEGDECEVSAKWNDPPKWVSAGHTVGQPAPDPQFPAHRRYRRLIVNFGPTK